LSARKRKQIGAVRQKYSNAPAPRSFAGARTTVAHFLLDFGAFGARPIKTHQYKAFHPTENLMEALKQGSDALFILLGAIMVLAMHSGFAFLELGTVRKKNQVNALVKILVDFSISTVAYFLVGYTVAYGTSFLVGADQLAAKSGYELVKFFFLLTFAAAIPAIISGGIAERARFGPQLIATAVIVGLIYPLFEGVAWNQRFGIQA
jgi:Amt family ammonium transporter